MDVFHQSAQPPEFCQDAQVYLRGDTSPEYSAPDIL